MNRPTFSGILNLILLLLFAGGSADAVGIGLSDLWVDPTIASKLSPSESEFLAGRIRSAIAALGPTWQVLPRGSVAHLKDYRCPCDDGWSVVGQEFCVRPVGPSTLVLEGRVLGEGSMLRLVLRVRASEGSAPIESLSVSTPDLRSLLDSSGDAARRLLEEVPGAKGLDPNAMVRIPGGCFDMGSPPGTGSGAERPRHRVCLDSFRMDATEATRDQFRLVMGWDPSHFHDCAGNCPVTDVSWDNANDFCRLLGKRLPTEAEWEYASRAGTRSRWAWGEDEDSAGIYAWYRGNSGKRPHPVGGLRPNAWGLHDMAGNAREWTSDQPTLYASDSTHAAQEIFPGFRIVRGGSYLDIASLLRPTARTRVDSYGDDLGFRCAAP